MSASSTPTRRPASDSAAARLTVSDDLPTPPLPLAIASTRVERSMAMPFERSATPPLSFVVSAAFSSGDMTSKATAVRANAGDGADVPRDLLLEARAKRTTGDGERDRHGHVPAVDPDLAHHVQVGDRAPELRVDDLLERLPDLVARRLHRD